MENCKELKFDYSEKDKKIEIINLLIYQIG